MPDWLVTTTAGRCAALSRATAPAAPGRSRIAPGLGEVARVLDQRAVPVEEDGLPAGHCQPAPRPRRRDRGRRCLRVGCADRAAAGRRRSAPPPAARRPEAQRQPVGAERGRRRAPRASSAASAPGNAPPPTADSGPRRLGATPGGQAAARRPARARELGRVAREHAQRRHLAPRRLRVAVQRERRLERGQRQLVGPHRAGERIARGTRATQRLPAHEACRPAVRRAACRR